VVDSEDCSTRAPECKKRFFRRIGVRHRWLAFSLLTSGVLHVAVLFLAMDADPGSEGWGKEKSLAHSANTLSVSFTSIAYEQSTPPATVEVNAGAKIVGGRAEYAVERKAEGGVVPNSGVEHRHQDLKGERGDGSASLSLSGVAYIPLEMLTVRPRPLGEVLLDSEEMAGMVSERSMVLELRVSERGEVVDVVIKSSELPEEVSSSVANAFRKLRFLPGELNGRKVGTVMRVGVGRYATLPLSER